MTKHWISALAVLMIAGATVVAGDVKLDGVKCVVADRDAQPSKSADYKEGKVYFCCGGCAGKFAKTEKKFAVQANRQLVQTGQYEQTGCPFSGGDVNPETVIKVAGAKVGFCCDKCQGKVEAADAKKQATFVFSEKAFAKGFKKAKKKS